MRLTSTVPALPVTDVVRAVAFYADRLGFVARHQDEGFAIVVRDAAELHLWEAGDTGWRLRDPADLGDCPVRTGAEDFIAGTASCRIAADEVDTLHDELAAAGVLHPTDSGSPDDTDWGTREFAALDLDNNLLTFFARVLGP
ncbi:hypothetical protein NPS01_29870 [Nocardioides psychrotolerans]|uniref:Bleomycin resistance protein n=1 Tax=Nocardioides psychrotolerans TaxID=1005945 RepID=A0A1I3GJV9_9ACTN|nr:VOC family protein [Nocardioides psychrotolerans]GEP39324.1 hypothetical protein NPS01_29870 [Nocardioides psychrotolerans]SFI23703.1 Glyoxalase/Bleomycin resistance protein/Dioxygenase superfamily protein [Nocardioides psychrotolerans]